MPYTNTDHLKIEVAKLKAQLKRNDADIEDHEYRQDLRRRHGDRLYNRLLLLEDQLRRAGEATAAEGTLAVKRVMPC